MSLQGDHGGQRLDFLLRFGYSTVCPILLYDGVGWAHWETLKQKSTKSCRRSSWSPCLYLDIIVAVNLKCSMSCLWQIFSLTVFYGLFHGLAFLPVILMLIGTDSSSCEETPETSSQTRPTKKPPTSRHTSELPPFCKLSFINRAIKIKYRAGLKSGP